MGISYSIALFFGVEIEGKWYELEEQLAEKLLDDIHFENFGNNMSGNGLRSFIRVNVPEQRHRGACDFNGDITSLNLPEYQEIKDNLNELVEELGLTKIGEPGWFLAENVF